MMGFKAEWKAICGVALLTVSQDLEDKPFLDLLSLCF